MAKGVIRYHVLFVLRLAARAVHVAGLVPGPTEQRSERAISAGLKSFVGDLPVIDAGCVFTGLPVLGEWSSSAIPVNYGCAR